MSTLTIEKLINGAIRAAFVKYPEGDGCHDLNYEWIEPERSAQIAKAILSDLAANGFEIVKKAT